MILVYVEHQGDRISKSSLAAITAARKMKSEHGYSKIVGLLLGAESLDQAAKVAANYGLDEVLRCSDPVFQHYLSRPYSEVISAVAEQQGARAVVAVASSRGKDFAPRVAHRLSAGQASDCTDILPNNRFQRPIYAGNIFAEVEIRTDRKVITVRSSAFDAPETAPPCSIRELALSSLGTFPSKNDVEFVSFDEVKSERPELTDAEVVVSGGRALQSSENFEKYILPLADVLGAAVGASRAAVDSGYAPNDWQVGQTGKIVAPKLYIAVGISGAIQHLAGMKDSKVIVAINKDPEAPIFEIADYALVADLFTVVPELTEKIRTARAG